MFKAYLFLQGLLVAVGAGLLALDDSRGLRVVTGSLLLAGVEIALAWFRASGTALRPAIIWAGISIGLAVLGEYVAFGESPLNGRPASNQWFYLSVLAGLAAFLSVLNARSPGSGAWALLMLMLVVVFLLPWLEGAWMVRQREGWDRLRLVFPWTWFFVLLVIAGVTNYLPTKFGPAAFLALVGFSLAWLGLSRTEWTNPARGRLWAWVPWCWAASVWLAGLTRVRPAEASRSSLDHVWLWFRDHWGAVWAIRTRDRFNATAKAVGWGFRLDWTGASSDDVPPEAATTFANLLRRFADKERIERATHPIPAPRLAVTDPFEDHG